MLGYSLYACLVVEEVKFLLGWKVVKMIAPCGGNVLKCVDSCGFWRGQIDRFVERVFAKSGATDFVFEG